MRFLKSNSQFKPIKDAALLRTLNELSRTVNISSTYGKDHPAAQSALEKTAASLQCLFTTRTKFTLGSFNGVMTLDDEAVRATGTLLTALERRLSHLRITSLKISWGTTTNELKQLIVLLSSKEEGDFKAGIKTAGLQHISSDETTLQSIKKGESVVNSNDITGMGSGGLGDEGNGVIDLDGFDEEDDEAPAPDIHVDQIVAFLKGDIHIDDENPVGKELEELASDPARLAKLIMDSVAIRQSAADFSGESLGDIVLGCLRRTYDGLRQRPAFQTADGKADLRKALLLLEDNILNKLRGLTEGNDPELDREIVQTIQEMDATLGFEASAIKYNAHKKAMERDKEEMMDFVRTQGKEVAEGLIQDSDIPMSQWHRIVVENEPENSQSEQTVMSGIETLANVFERLEAVIKSTDDTTHDEQVKNLLGQANENLDDSIDTTREKLELLSRQLEIAKAGGTIGGQGRKMDQRELLAALAEVAQELMQPITAITASLEMMLNGFVGDITEEQRDLLGVAANSGEHLKYLMKELIDIVGCPTNKGVDNRFHTTSDEVVQMIDTVGQEHLNLGYFQ